MNTTIRVRVNGLFVCLLLLMGSAAESLGQIQIFTSNTMFAQSFYLVNEHTNLLENQTPISEVIGFAIQDQTLFDPVGVVNITDSNDQGSFHAYASTGTGLGINPNPTIAAHIRGDAAVYWNRTFTNRPGARPPSFVVNAGRLVLGCQPIE